MLRPEDRLTLPHAGHERKRTQYGYTAYWTQASKFALMDRLGEYEDTGLTPEEIKTLVRRCAEVCDLADRLEKRIGK